MNYLSLTIPDAQGNPIQIQAPSGIPTGGLEAGGAGQKLIQLGVQLLIVTAIIIALFYIIWAGFTWMTSQGDKAQVDSAKHKLTFAIIGLIIVFLAFFIIRVIGTFFGVPLLPLG